jgi:hypothetical protein
MRFILSSCRPLDRATHGISNEPNDLPIEESLGHHGLSKRSDAHRATSAVARAASDGVYTPDGASFADDGADAARRPNSFNC